MKIILTAYLLWIAGFITAQDAQWRGPLRNGIYPDTGLLKEWPEDGPRLILKKEGLGNGLSTPVLYDHFIFITGKRDSSDVITKLDLEGNILWETVYGTSWEASYPESRNTPTIENNRIYITSGMGTVSCIDAVSGNILWSRNTQEEFDGEFHRWGMAESLLLTGKAVISCPVGKQTAVVALDKNTGDLIWKSRSLGGQRSYASPIVANHHGREMILMQTSKDLLAVKPENGEILWSYDLVTDLAPRSRRNNTNSALYFNGEVFVTSGYDAESVMLKLSEDGTRVDLKWHNAALDSHHGGVVVINGLIFGSNWINNGNGNWVCQDWETGNVMFEEKWHNKGSIIYADGLLYVLEEKNGHVGLINPVPEKLEVISSFRLEGGTGPYWAHMSIYDKKLFIRHGQVLFVYDLSA